MGILVQADLTQLIVAYPCMLWAIRVVLVETVVDMYASVADRDFSARLLQLLVPAAKTLVRQGILALLRATLETNAKQQPVAFAASINVRAVLQVGSRLWALKHASDAETPVMNVILAW